MWHKKGCKAQFHSVMGRYLVFKIKINTGSYTSAHVLLNLINELGKEIKCKAPNGFNKFNNTRAPTLDFIYHMTLRLL